MRYLLRRSVLVNKSAALPQRNLSAIIGINVDARALQMSPSSAKQFSFRNITIQLFFLFVSGKHCHF